MARNVEIKARIDSVEALAPIVARLTTQGPVPIDQDDTFFRCKTGRLKLRAFSSTEGELIYYRRPDDAGPKTSFYLRSPTSAPDALRESLTFAYGEAGRVIKRRTLYRVGRTRVHLDRVEGLGEFVEIEVVLRDDESPEEGVAEAQRLMEALAIAPDRLIDRAYVDLLCDNVDRAVRPANTKSGERSTREALPIELDHTIVPSRDRRAAAELLARILGVRWSETGVGPFCPVYVSDGLTLDIDQADAAFPTLHYCFRMSDDAFDGLVSRLQALGIAYRSAPHGPADMQVNTHHGGRIVYWSEPDGHVWEALTVSYARPPSGADRA